MYVGFENNNKSVHACFFSRQIRYVNRVDTEWDVDSLYIVVRVSCKHTEPQTHRGRFFFAHFVPHTSRNEKKYVKYVHSELISHALPEIVLNGKLPIPTWSQRSLCVPNVGRCLCAHCGRKVIGIW